MSNTPDSNPRESGASDRDDPDERGSHPIRSDENGSCLLSVPISWDDSAKRILDDDAIAAAVRLAAAKRGFTRGEIGIRLTTDADIREINARHLNHDYATDVISFGYDADSPRIEGELVVSVDTAIALAAKMDWPATNELLLYIVHGVLHITGMDDKHPDDRLAMREAERIVMLGLGIDQITRCGADREFGLQSDDTASEETPRTPEVSP